MLKAKLVVVGGDAKQTEFDLRLPLVIGRGRDVGLTVPHALVSRRHTEIIERDGRLLVRDLGSLNGTFINNHRIESEQILEPDQLLTLGNITFRAVYQIGEEADSGYLTASLDTATTVQGVTESAINDSSSKETALDQGLPESAMQGETIPIDSFVSPDDETLPQGSLPTAHPESTHDRSAKQEPSPTQEGVSENVEPIEKLDSLVELGLQDDEFPGDPDDSSTGSFVRKLPR